MKTARNMIVIVLFCVFAAGCNQQATIMRTHSGWTAAEQPSGPTPTPTQAADAGAAGEHQGWMTDFASARKLATEKGLPILADFSGSDWCSWCIRLDNEVFSQDVFKAYAKEHFVLFLADYPMRKTQAAEVVKQNKVLQEQYKVRGFPTVLVLDPTGEVVARTGYRRGGADAYVRHLRELIDKTDA